MGEHTIANDGSEGEGRTIQVDRLVVGRDGKVTVVKQNKLVKADSVDKKTNPADLLARIERLEKAVFSKKTK